MLCLWLACNIGHEFLIKSDDLVLSRDRLSWVQQNYGSSKNTAKLNARFIDYHTDLTLAQKIGSGDIVSGDGMRFACAVKSVNSGPNSLCVPGILRDSLYVLDVLTQQRTKLNFQEVMVDTAGTKRYSIYALLVTWIPV